MGLTLRGLENKQEKLKSLRNKILKRYGTEGLHFAEFVQNGFFGKLVGNVLQRIPSPSRLKSEIENLLMNIEKTVVFIKQADDVDKRTEEIIIKINANSPNTFIICSSGTAKVKCEEIKEKVMGRISGYDAELYKTKFKEIYFINKSEESYR